ncbi:hypothetical protein D9615_002936 [Tricholomella constricta]|uniref:F-actin-capping protein subunit alpha n=1 Tax=Tricholomella constricta TaxID=117010 RepID=A0A8H5HG61_9AGAR|nr:hypothetical protein D9615_002936 [Tricholomella constricta]
MDERIQAASNFLLQSPPGEINDVLNDVRNIISDDDLLKDGILPALTEYNLAQFIVVDVPGADHQSIISEAARIPAAAEDGAEETEQRFLDPRSKTSFVFNHIGLEASDSRTVEPDPDSEPFRHALETAVISYLLAHFLEGVGSVFVTPGVPNRFIIQIVANKYNPTNYWSGRWRSEYIVDLSDNTVTGRILVNVHYYEQGNVQLATTHELSLTLPPAVVTATPSAAASKILALIGDQEGHYQRSLNETYHEMGEKTFKGLRRALPMTRQKIDWDKVLGYKLGAELTSSKGMMFLKIIAHDDYDFAHFSAGNGAKIAVTVRGKVPIEKISIVSSRFDYDNKPQLHKNTLTWYIKDHKYFILKIEGLRELVVAVDPLETFIPPSTGPNIFNVVSGQYKADKLGKRLTTHAFHAAIADASQSKRADPIVYVPPGVYLVGNLVLPSKTSLYLAPGAVLRFTGHPKDYTQHWVKDGEGRAGTYWISTAHNSTDVKVFGRGTIDANAYAYKDAKFAPSSVVAVMTSNFTFDGPILRESGSTAFNVVRSNAVDIRNLKVFNRLKDMLDNGSVDVVESQNVTVSDAIAISVADTFTTKASKPASATVPAWPGALQNSTDITFQHCLAWTGNYGFKVGQGAMADQKNIKFFASTVYEAAVGMGIHKKWGRGSATNVTFENMIIKSTSFTTSHLGGIVGSWLALFVEDGKVGVGPISDVHVKNVLVMGTSGTAPLIRGVTGANVSNVEFQNIWLPQATQPAASLEDLGLKELKFATNVTVVNTWRSPNATAKATPQPANATAPATGAPLKSKTQPGAEQIPSQNERKAV